MFGGLERSEEWPDKCSKCLIRFRALEIGGSNTKESYSCNVHGDRAPRHAEVSPWCTQPRKCKKNVLRKGLDPHCGSAPEERIFSTTSAHVCRTIVDTHLLYVVPPVTYPMSSLAHL